MFSRMQSSFRSGLTTSIARGYKKTIEQLAKEKPTLLKDAKVLVRVDFNVPVDKKDASKLLTILASVKHYLPSTF